VAVYRLGPRGRLRSGIERVIRFLILNEFPSPLQEIFEFAIGQGPLGRFCFARSCHWGSLHSALRCFGDKGEEPTELQAS
jgi:hypothetical protein